MSILQKVKKAASRYKKSVQKSREERTELRKAAREAYKKAYAKERVIQAGKLGKKKAQAAVQIRVAPRRSPLQTFLTGEFPLPKVAKPKIKRRKKKKRKKRK